ncbi:amino acid adenylation domain-containing protein [Pyxidicoccus fallax]|uniref:Amino acid adenylation domain-containing protein n=1 Tax=Pyxidicoccus fallax TaxID=394095 RepID=A0A848LLV5_9BACT|nr:non-ribosomal peptide synthetase [Pyxidicoccus fallax]NMO18679.1 amino acid adenylation domain-containing protein [Pyxidicoccus fallax]NPC79130.1 amino acid adenylation domain-containing protein [Pyxidicoccus fallax]
MSDISKQLSKLSPKQRELFEALLRQRQKQQEAAAPPALRKRSGEGPLPASFAQQRLWLLHQIEGGSASAYNIAVAVRLNGALVKSALERALKDLVHRHEALRTRFRTGEDGLPLQDIQPDGEHPLTVVDLSGMPEAPREAEARRLATEEGQRPFDLESGPLFRTTLLRLATDRHVLLLSMHHSISDGWSTAVLAQEMAVLYTAYASGRTPMLPPLAVQYSDYSLWQREWLRGPALQTQLDYWRRQLAEVPALLELPTDRPRPSAQTFRGAAVRVEVGAKLSEAAVALGQRHGATPFMVLLATWQLLLSRYSGQQDVCVGSPIAGRTRPELESLIGFFVNTLVLRSQVSPELSFRELLAQVKATTLAAYEQQDVPFERLVEELRPKRSLSYSPLFQVMFVLQNTPGTEQKLPGLDVEVLRPDVKTTQFDLTLALAESPGGFSGILTYNTDLFDAATAERMVGHYLTLLSEAVRAPDTQVRALSLLSPEESLRMLETGRGPAVATPEDWRQCLHRRFAAQAARTPDATALVCGEQRLSYAELDARANRLAWYLRGQGVGPEVRVGVCAERSPELVVALLGILKAGGAYVPLDPGYPADRLAFMLEDAGLALVLTQRPLVERLGLPGERVLCLDSEAARFESQPREAAPDSGVRPEHLAYVIYTSGSTGRPKGVTVTHANLAHSTFARVAAYPEPMERYLMLSSFAFDSSVAGIFWALSQGGTLVLPVEGAQQEPRHVARTVARERATHLLCSPGLYQFLLAEHAESRALESLKVAIVAGEACPRELVRQHHALLPAALYNEYGPTEASVWCTMHRCSADDARPLVPIGRPIPNTAVYLLDASLQPVPAGVPGELFVGGAGVTRGYLNRPELTAERFLADPFSPVPDARMYRTGDRVRLLSDGSLEFLGRVDQQVKVRGFRIEPGEIESVLRQHPAVRDAVVVARQYIGGDTRLVAYVVPKEGHTLETESLRGHVQQHLPAFMVPSAFVPLSAMPLTPNGKVDRKALPAPDASASGATAASYKAPRTPVEQRLAALWREVLGVERVGVANSFFELGGHSLLAVQVMSRIRATFGVDLPLRTLFEHRNVEALARVLEQLGEGALAGASRSVDTREEAPARSIPQHPTAVGRATGPVSIAQRRWLSYAVSNPSRPKSAGNIPLCVHIKGRLDVEALERALNTLVERHEILRTHYARSDDGFAFQVSPLAPVRLEQLDFVGLPREQCEEVVRHRVYQDAHMPFDLMAPPMFRAWLYKLGPEEQMLLVTTHHIAWDGWSEAILFQEVTLAYRAYVRGEEPQLPELRIQYSDFAWWQHEQMRGEHLESLESYWRRHLADGVTMVDFPLDKPRPATRTYNTLINTVTFPVALSAAIKAVCHREGVTLYMMAMAAYQALLALRSGARDVTVFSNIGSRDRLEIENLIGCFTNVVLIRTNLEGDPTFQELLARVRDAVLGALAHSALPYQRVLDMIGMNPDSKSARTFPGLNMQNFQQPGDTRPSVDGLQFDRVSIPQGGSLLVNMFFFVSESENQQVSLMAQANGDLYEARTVERIVEDFQRLLEAGCAAPDQRLSALLSGGPDRPEPASAEAS